MEALDMGRRELLFIVVLALTFVAGLAIPILMVRSKRLGTLSRAYLEAGIKHKWAAVTFALFLCTLATFSIVVSRVVVVPGDSGLYFMLGPSGASWTALLFSAWLIARALPSWRSTSVPQRTLLASTFAWAFALLLVV